jgi:hypothetical protein
MPWAIRDWPSEVGGGWSVVDEHGRPLGPMSLAPRALAERIVRAMNAHDALLAVAHEADRLENERLEAGGNCSKALIDLDAACPGWRIW